MKKLRSIISLTFLICSLSTGFLACSEKKSELVTDSKATVDPSVMTFSSSDINAQTLRVIGNIDFTLRSDADWCRFQFIKNESDFNKTYSVTCAENTQTESRSTKIHVLGADKSEMAVVTINQEGTKISDPSQDNYPSDLTQEKIFDAMGLGWNLGNQMDAHANGVANETCWGNPKVDRSIFDALKRAGFKSVRIPITWMGHIGNAPEYKIQDEWLERVAQLVDYAEQAGLVAILNIHHDGANSENWLDIKNAAVDADANKKIEAELAALWSQIAKRFADKGEFLIFESMNEIHDGGWGWGANRTDGGKQYKTFNHWQQVFVDAVRNAGGKNETRWLGIPTYCTNIDLSKELVLPKDPSNKLMVAVHCYEPYEYTLNATYSEWGHTGAANAKPTNDEGSLRYELDAVINYWVSKGIPAYIGEFGCVRRDNDRAESFRKYYLKYYAKASSERKLPILYWDNGASGTGTEQSGLFNRVTGEFINDSEDIVNAMVECYYNQGITLDQVFNSAP